MIPTQGSSPETMVMMPDKPVREAELEDNKVHDENDEDSTVDDANPSKKSSKICRNDRICLPCLAVRGGLESCWEVRGSRVRLLLKYAVLLSFLVYVSLAFRHHFGNEASIRLLVIAVCVVCVLAGKRCGRTACVQNVVQEMVNGCVRPCHRLYRNHSAVIDTCVILMVVASILTFLIVDVAVNRPASLLSAVGIAVFITVMYLASHDPRQVEWRPVCWGMLLQFVFALLVLRTEWGRTSFNWLSARITEYMRHTDVGAQFVFGDNFREHFFAFRVMPTVIFFGATIAILYYLGTIQVIIRVIASVMRVTMATGALETFHSAVNIFCGWAEALMVIHPFMETMTMSELHAVMTNGFATVAGSAIGAYSLYGVSVNHLISASFMSAPAALAMTKLFYPDDRKSNKTALNIKNIPRQGMGVIDAASQGAVATMTIVVHIIVTVIAFFSLLSFINSTLEWLGDRIGLTPPHYPRLTFQLICSYLLWPVVFLLGVPVRDCKIVARLLGVKIFINEFIAYSDLGNVRTNRIVLEKHMASNGTWQLIGQEGSIELLGTNRTLVGGVLTPRSEMLATFALCGFSDFVALGIMTATLSSVVPSRRQHIVQLAPRALVSGIMACLLTAAMAGLVADDENLI